MIELINETWRWSGAEAKAVISVNDFGSIIFKSDDAKYWRIRPEELSCKMISENQGEFDELKLSKDFLNNWEMKNQVDEARKELGELLEGEKYCLKLPTVIGGLYETSNFGKISHTQLISFSGQMASQINDLPDGAKIEFNV